MQVNPQRIRLEIQTERRLLPPADGKCFLPTVRWFDQRYLPIWNPCVLREEWALQRRQEQDYRAERGLLTHKQLADSRTWLTARSMAGPLPRALLAEAMGVDLKVVHHYAKAHGFWVRSKENEMGQDQSQQLMFRLFADYGEGNAPIWFDYDDQIQADIAAQAEIDELRSRTLNKPEVPAKIGIWEVLSDPFLAVEKRYGLSWWVEHRCSAPGCKHRRSRWRPIQSLQQSKAKQCKQHSLPSFVDLNDLTGAGDAYMRMRRRHVPSLLYGTPELAHPDMAQGALEDFKRLLADPPSVQEPKPVPPPKLAVETSLYSMGLKDLPCEFDFNDPIHLTF